MKIKRFESETMTGALKLIKQEFGDEAVILSAKSYKKTTGLLSGKQPTKVVVTAAVDTSAESAKKMSRRTQANNRNTTIESDAVDHPTTAVGKLDFFKRFNPITRTGQQKLQRKFVGMAKESNTRKTEDTLLETLVSKGLEKSIAEEIHEKVTVLVQPGIDTPEELCTALSQVVQAQQIVGRPSSTVPDAPRIVVLVGPSGVGKTTLAAKLAAMEVRKSPASVHMVSMDDQRVAGCAELERYADILDIRLTNINDPVEVSSLTQSPDCPSLIVVDTPGLGADDIELRNHLSRMITALPGAEVHLLLNADSQNGSLSKVISFFKPLGIHYLGFSRLDWADTTGGMINQANATGLPISYLSETAKVNHGAQWASADRLVHLLMANTSTFSENRSKDNGVMGSPSRKQETRLMNYVANRNSDIFHKYTCQSVKRINSDNMVAFNDPAEAMGRQFKPCRMCCGELLVSKPIQRVAYKYASSR